MDVLLEVAMKLLVTPLSEISSEIACEIAVIFCAMVFRRGTNFTGISFAISPAISLRGLLATSRQFHQQFHYQFHETNCKRGGTRQTMKMRPISLPSHLRGWNCPRPRGAPGRESPCWRSPIGTGIVS